MFALQVVGHSLGGALASLTATYVTNTSLFAGNDVRLVTFGQPRTGNLAYSKVVTSSVSETCIYAVKTSLFFSLTIAIESFTTTISYRIYHRRSATYQPIIAHSKFGIRTTWPLASHTCSAQNQKIQTAAIVFRLQVGRLAITAAITT